MLERRKAYNPPVEWTLDEEKLLLEYLEENSFDSKQLKAMFPLRTLPSIRSKVRKLRIKYDLFGSSYRNEKECFTTQIAQEVRPKIVFDAYAGAGHQTFKWIEFADIIYASEKMKCKLWQFEVLAKYNQFKKENTLIIYMYSKKKKENILIYWRRIRCCS